MSTYLKGNIVFNYSSLHVRRENHDGNCFECGEIEWQDFAPGGMQMLFRIGQGDVFE